MRRMSAIRCPHCDASALVCAHHQPSPLVRNEWHRCVNLECGHTFSSVTRVHYTVRPSATPRPDVSLPMTRNPNVRRRYPANGEQVARTVRVLTLSVVSARTGLTKRDVLTGSRAGWFPAPVGLKGQAPVWSESAVEAFNATRATQRRSTTTQRAPNLGQATA